MSHMLHSTGLAAWDGSIWINLVNVNNGSVMSSILDNNHLYISGSFTSINGLSHNKISRLELNTSGGTISVATLSQLSNSILASSTAFDLCLVNSNLYIGGDQPQYPVSIYNINTDTWGLMNVPINGIVYAIISDTSNNIYFGGSIDTVDGDESCTVFKVSYDNVLTNISVGDAPIEIVYTMVADSSNNILVAGVGGEIKRWDGITWEAFDPSAQFTGSIYNLTFDNDGNLYAGGRFIVDETLEYGYQKIAKHDGTQWSYISSNRLHGPYDSTINIIDSSPDVDPATIYDIFFDADNNYLTFAGQFNYMYNSNDTITNRINIADYAIDENAYRTSQLNCVTADCEVLTPTGYVSITKLSVGDKVMTSDFRIVEIKNIKITNLATLKNWKQYAPYIIPAGAIAMNYPPQDIKVSPGHLIQYNKLWLLPDAGDFEKDYSNMKIKYYHIELPNYLTDDFIINGGTVVESNANKGTNRIRDEKEYQMRRSAGEVNMRLILQARKELLDISLNQTYENMQNQQSIENIIMSIEPIVNTSCSC